ncbi:MAG: hypothetical protein GXO79_04460 [Chlorobi bacterium]|nr:hypothetical protein [Chlorobiota bacterium]
MKKILFTVLLLVFVQFSFSQKSVATQEQIQAFLKTKTLVVLDPSPLSDYNIEIQETIKKHWDITEYEFIAHSEFEKKRVDPKYSFLIMNRVFYTKDKTQAQYNFLHLLLGGDYLLMKDMPELASVPVSYLEVDESSYSYKLGILVRFMQNHVKLTRDNPNLNNNNIIRYYNKNMVGVREKTLYVIQDELAKNVNTLKKIHKIYPYDVKIVTKEDIEDAINRHDENVVLLHKVGPENYNKKARCWNVLIGASDAKLYYFAYHMVSAKKPDGFLAEDFKKLAKKELLDIKKQEKKQEKQNKDSVK